MHRPKPTLLLPPLFPVGLFFVSVCLSFQAALLARDGEGLTKPSQELSGPKPLEPVSHPSFGDRDPMAWFRPKFSQEALRATERELEKRQLVTRLIHAFRYNWKSVIPRALKRLQRLAPNSTELYYFQALQAYQKGEKGKAWFLVEKSLEIWPEYARAWNLRGILLGETDRYNEALESFAKALHWAPFHPVYLYNTASLLYRNGKYDAAQKRISEALEAKINLAEGYYLQGLIFKEQRKPRQALLAFEKALAFGYSSESFVLQYARLAHSTRDAEKQTRILPFLKKIPKPEARILQSRIHEGFGEYKKAALVLRALCKNAKTSSAELRSRYIRLLAKSDLNAGYLIFELPVKPEEQKKLLSQYNSLKESYQNRPSVKDAILKPFG